MSIVEKQTPGSTAGDPSGGFTPFIRALRKSWPIVASLALLGLGVSFFYAKSLPKIYDAAATIQVDPNVVRPLGDKEGMMPLGSGFFWDNAEYYETQYKIVTSQRVMSAVVRDLNLVSDPSFFGYAKAPARPHTLEQATSLLTARTRVEPVKGSRLFQIHVEDTDPKRARLICEKVANTYIEQNLQTAIDQSADAAVWLSGQIDVIKRDLVTNELALDKFKRDNNLPSTSINESHNILRLEMVEYDSALTKTRTHRAELAARHAELSKVASDKDKVDELPASELLSNNFLQQLRSLYQGAVRERKSLLAEGKAENHPQVKIATERMEEARGSLLREINNIQGAVAKDLAIIARQEAAQSGLYEAAKKGAVDLNIKEIEYRRLDFEREQKQKLYSLLQERMKEAELVRNMRVNNIQLLDKPLEPGDAVRPRMSIIVAIGLALGLFLGIAIAWLREVLDSSLKTPEDVEEKLGLTLLGFLPEIEEANAKLAGNKKKSRRRNIVGPSKHPELIVHEKPSSGIAEMARSLRTNLMFLNPDHPYRKLLVTSAAPSEGKTTVACNLAIALAQGGQRVCIVDCDLRMPRLHRIFERRGDSGVTSVLVGDATIEEVARPTVVDNLWCIPAGPIPPNPADMLHSERFKKFVRELGERFDRVIIDSPPLVAVTDSAIVSMLVDGTVFVIRAFKTTRALSRQGLRSLWDVDAPVVGAVLNAVNFNKHEYAYQYYYYRREGYGPLALEDQPPTAAAN